jgi:hypothetical protein
VQYAFMKKALAKRRVNGDPEKEAYWRRLIGDQSGSGLSIRAWCARRQVRESSYFWWRRELARRDADAPALVPVRVTADRSAGDAFAPLAASGSLSRIEIVFPDQRRVQVVGPVDRQALSDVLAVVASAKFIEGEAAAC